MSLLDLAIRTIVQIAEQQIIHKMVNDTGYVFTLKMSGDKGIIYYTHVIITAYPSVFLLTSNESNWKNINHTEWNKAINTSNHEECWKYSGFVHLEQIWEDVQFNRLEFRTGNFGIRLYEEVRISKEANGNYLYKLIGVNIND